MATDPYAALRWRDGEELWPSRPRRWRARTLKMRKLAAQGVEIAALAERFGVTTRQIYRAVREGRQCE